MPPKVLAGAKAKGKAGKKKDKKVKIQFLPRSIDPNHELYWCVAHGRTPSEIQPLIEGYKADVNRKNPIDRWTPLLRACHTGNAPVARLLLAFRADPNYQDKPVVPGQEEAAKGKGKGKGGKAAASASAPGARGPGRVDPKSSKSSKGEPPLNPKHLPPISMEPVADGGSALHVAIRCGSIETLDVILASIDLNPNLLDRQGRTPLLLAAGEGRPMAASHLIQQAKPNLFSKDSAGRNCMHLAAGRGHREVCAVLLGAEGGHRLLDERDDEKRSVLDHAMSLGNPRTVELIKSLRNDPAIKDADWLDYASRNGAVRLLPFKLSLCFQIPDASGDQVLIRLCHEILCVSDIALSGRQLEVARRILAEVEPQVLLWKNCRGQTALHVACGGSSPDTDTVLRALQRVANGDGSNDSSDDAENISSVAPALGTTSPDAVVRPHARETKPSGHWIEEAEANARLRLQRSLVRALLDRASLREDLLLAFTFEFDGRGLKPLDYTCITGGDPDLLGMLGGKPSAVVTKLLGITDNELPTSPSVSDRTASPETQRGLRESSPEPGLSPSRSLSPLPSPPVSARASGPSRPFSALSTRSSFVVPEFDRDSISLGDQSTAPSTRPQTPSNLYSARKVLRSQTPV